MWSLIDLCWNCEISSFTPTCFDKTAIPDSLTVGSPSNLNFRFMTHAFIFELLCFFFLSYLFHWPFISFSQCCLMYLPFSLSLSLSLAEDDMAECGRPRWCRRRGGLWGPSSGAFSVHGRGIVGGTKGGNGGSRMAIGFTFDVSE